MNSDKIQELVNMSFTLEAISDKKGCVTRYKDLDNKTLSDFLIAGINTSKYFRYIAQDIQKNKDTDIFTYFLEALKNSNQHKSFKTINFGLLEIMFPIVYARILCNDKSKIIKKTIKIMKKENHTDVSTLLKARTLAWQTSKNKTKNNFNTSQFESCKSPYELYIKFTKTYNKNNSSNQWGMEYLQGLPILKEFLSKIKSNETILDDIKKTFNKVKDKNPNTKIGIIADMCAAAIFIYLSYE